MKYRNLVLVGLMGTGKSSVGQALAEKLKWRFVDTDAAIEAGEGTSISSIFAERGEPAFRAIESKTIESAMRGVDQVVATGGGAVLAEQNRSWMKEGGLVVALTASADTIIERVSKDTNRPLVQGNVAERVHKIMAERKHAYDFADLMIDTTGLPVQAIVEQIEARLMAGKA
ncbi:shikimate kinase [Paenibacillus cremeus]|uniref:Shikimate kinase n=1 Tax=Paenibacillus cremeus TaxID=2163881 RepID=A0A559K3N9_9BACL|nr:shikimate kinase [Paenibacillus cremeus]TVY06755.1 shikimate kinase [Paenibacillus cremeus]